MTTNQKITIFEVGLSVDHADAILRALKFYCDSGHIDTEKYQELVLALGTLIATTSNWPMDKTLTITCTSTNVDDEFKTELEIIIKQISEGFENGQGSNMKSSYKYETNYTDTDWLLELSTNTYKNVQKHLKNVYKCNYKYIFAFYSKSYPAAYVGCLCSYS